MTLASSDQLTRFMLPELGIRGVAIHLQDSLSKIQSRPEYSEAVSQLLGEAVAAASILSSHVKVDGRLSLQLKSNGALRTLFAESTANHTVRGIAQIAEDMAAPEVMDLTANGLDQYLAITIENRGVGNREMQRYQGLVEVNGPTLAGALENYFVQSEQLPTRFLLAAGNGQAAGLMLQKLPETAQDQDGWDRATALFDTLGEAELLETASADVLHRLFHEETLDILETQEIGFACSCSRERARDMLASLGPEEGVEPTEDDTNVKCEFCGEEYVFTASEMAEIHSEAESEQAATSTLH